MCFEEPLECVHEIESWEEYERTHTPEQVERMHEQLNEEEWPPSQPIEL